MSRGDDAGGVAHGDVGGGLAEGLSLGAGGQWEELPDDYEDPAGGEMAGGSHWGFLQNASLRAKCEATSNSVAVKKRMRHSMTK